MNEIISSHWLNKLLIGKGTREQFAEDYEKVNAGDNQFATASQLFPTGSFVSNSEKQDIIYEFFIYYKVNPTAIAPVAKKETKLVI